MLPKNILKEDSSELVARTYKLHFSQLVIKDGDDVLRIVVWLNALRKIFGMLPPQMQWRISMMCRSFVVMSAGVLQHETYYHDVTGYYIIPAGEKILISDKRRAECWVTKKAFFDHRGSLIDIQSLMIHSLVGKPFSVPRK